MDYFQQHSAVFLRNIYQSPKGAIRLAVLQRDLRPLLEGRPRRILDLGGGAGQMALWYASLGHEVTLIDAAEALLQEAERQAQNLKLPGKIQLIAGDFFHCTPPQKYDFIACHAVLEWLENGDDLLRLCTEHLQKSAFLSLLYYNRTALEFAQHVFGNFAQLAPHPPRRKRAKLLPQHPRSIAEVEALWRPRGLHLQRRSAVRCFYDYMKASDRERHSLEAILERELAMSSQAQWLPVARYVHECLQFSSSSHALYS